jgi:uncharacterized protein YegL
MPNDFEQIPHAGGKIVPFSNAIFAENPEPRCPCLLLLDTSSSMAGRPIEELNAGLVAFKDELMADSLAAKRVEIGIVTFGPPLPVIHFQTADTFQPPVLSAAGDTPMGAAIELGLAMLRDRKDEYRRNGVEYYRPWMFLITDGAPTDPWLNAAHQVQLAESSKTVQFFAVGVEGANFEILRQISAREPLALSGLRFRDMFMWLSNSLHSVSQSRVGEQVPLVNPTAPGGWGSVG